METTLIAQAAALLVQILGRQLGSPSSLEEIEQRAHEGAAQIANAAIQSFAQRVVEQAEVCPPACACGAQPEAKQRRRRSLLVLAGLVHVRLRRYRCPACGTWRCPGAEVLQLRPKQRMTRTVQQLICQFGLAWSFVPGARLLGKVLPGVAVSAKTVERCVQRCAQAVAEREEAAATAAAEDAPGLAGSAPAFDNPRRVYVGLDGILVWGRAAKEKLEIQVGSLWSRCVEVAGRRHARREITDRSVVARAAGWETLGRHVWSMFVRRGGAVGEGTEVVVLGDGASGIRSLWELHFGGCLALLDPWHLWEKVKQRSREVLGKKEVAWEACQAVWEWLKVGAVDAARQRIEAWPAASDWAKGQRERLIGYLERNRDTIGNYEALRAAGYQVGSGPAEKANDMVVAPRMKNGKMHWSRAGANGVALLRAVLISDPDASFLPI
jgi:hypothetical protein